MGLFDSKKLSIQITEEFTDAASKLDKVTKSKIIDIQQKLMSNPNSKGLNLEAVKLAIDDVYSIRVDQTYRIILLYPHDDNGLYIFLYVDTHDKAYDWAKDFRYDINQNGAFQVYKASPEKTTATNLVAILKNVKDEQFNYIEIPECFWDPLREKTYTKKQLKAYKDYISEGAMLVLESVFDGTTPIESIESTFDQLTVSPFEDNIVVPEALFLKYSNSDLSKIGVPEEYIDLVKAIKFKSELSDLQNKLPKDAVQGLYSLLNGVPLEEIVKIANEGSKPTKKIKEALINDNSKSVVVQVSTPEELKEILDYPMEKWRIFLHPQQRGQAYKHYNGAARVLGGAGTGKTVISVHHAKFLAQEQENGVNGSILVTTFNHTLAEDIIKRLEMICSVYERKKILVMTVDSLAHEIMKGERYTIRYDSRKDYRTQQNLFEMYWNDAKAKVNLNEEYDYEFLKDEWAYVIQAQNIKKKEDYLKASRTGRGKKLNQNARETVWAICEEYRKLIEQRKEIDIDYAENKAAELISSSKKQGMFRSIIVDECQDLSAPAIRMLRALAGEPHEDDLFFSGDTRQSIYNKGKIKLSQCNVVINNRSTTLKLNYRTTNEIYNFALKLQKEYEYDDLDGAVTNNDKSICVYHGDEPAVKGFDSVAAEMNAVISDIKRKIGLGFTREEVCVVARTGATVTAWTDALINAGVGALQLGNKVSDDKSNPGVRVATMHRVKGMEFDCMYVVGVNQDVMPPKRDIKRAEGNEEIENIIISDANLLSVAITRARKTAWVSYNGKPSDYINVLKEEDEEKIDPLQF